MANKDCEYCEGEGFAEEMCGMCNGSGEGRYDGSTCQTCRGKGFLIFECDCEDCEGEDDE